VSYKPTDTNAAATTTAFSQPLEGLGHTSNAVSVIKSLEDLTLDGTGVHRYGIRFKPEEGARVNNLTTVAQLTMLGQISVSEQSPADSPRESTHKLETDARQHAKDTPLTVGGVKIESLEMFPPDAKLGITPSREDWSDNEFCISADDEFATTFKGGLAFDPKPISSVSVALGGASPVSWLDLAIVSQVNESFEGLASAVTSNDKISQVTERSKLQLSDGGSCESHFNSNGDRDQLEAARIRPYPSKTGRRLVRWPMQRQEQDAAPSAEPEPIETAFRQHTSVVTRRISLGNDSEDLAKDVLNTSSMLVAIMMIASSTARTWSTLARKKLTV
jgi:hypothetical protein